MDFSSKNLLADTDFASAVQVIQDMKMSREMLCIKKLRMQIFCSVSLRIKNGQTFFVNNKLLG